MTLGFNFYCVATLTILGIYQLPYFNVDQDGNKLYPKFFLSYNAYTDELQDGTHRLTNYTYPSLNMDFLDAYCDNVVDCDTSGWYAVSIPRIYDKFTTFTFTLRYVDDNGNQDRRNYQLTPSSSQQVTEPIFGSFVGNFHCPGTYETEYFRKVFTITKPDGSLFNEYSTYVNFTIYTTKTSCAGGCNRATFNIHDYVQLENQFDEPIIPIPEEPEQTESENSE